MNKKDTLHVLTAREICLLTPREQAQLHKIQQSAIDNKHLKKYLLQPKEYGQVIQYADDKAAHYAASYWIFKKSSEGIAKGRSVQTVNFKPLPYIYALSSKVIKTCPKLESLHQSFNIRVKPSLYISSLLFIASVHQSFSKWVVLTPCVRWTLSGGTVEDLEKIKGC